MKVDKSKGVSLGLFLFTQSIVKVYNVVTVSIFFVIQACIIIIIGMNVSRYTKKKEGRIYMKQYIFNFSTHHQQPVVWEETIIARGMMDACIKAKKLCRQYEREKQISIRIQYKGVRYCNEDIA